MISNSDILVIDDNIDIANIVKSILELDGYNVNVFNDPFLALDYFKSNSNEKALVITDIRMPGMSGPELISRIKRIKSEIKVIFMTAFDMGSIKPEIEKYDYEVAKIFQKPLSMRNLRKFVKEILLSATDTNKR